MRPVVIALAALAALTLAGCATTGRPAPEPRIVVQTVKVPVATPCPDRRPPATDIPRTVEDLRQRLAALPNTGERTKAVSRWLVLAMERLNADDAQIAACAARPPDG